MLNASNKTSTGLYWTLPSLFVKPVQRLKVVPHTHTHTHTSTMLPHVPTCFP